MSTLTYVKPANPNSKFWTTVEVKGYQNFPDTFKTYPPLWSNEHHKFLFKDLTDEEVYKLAKRCKLSYEEGSKDGRIIDTFDLYHDQDPFFNHSLLKIKIHNDVHTFNNENPLDALKLALLKSYPFVANSTSDLIPNAKWIVVNEVMEKEKVVDKYVKEREIWKYFTPNSKDKLSPERLRAIAYAFNDPVKLNFNANTNIETVEAALLEKAKDLSRVGGITNQDKFLMLVSLKPEEIKVRATIGKAISVGVLRTRGDKYFYGGNELAVSLDSLVKKLTSPDYSATYAAIEEEIKLKDV